MEEFLLLLWLLLVKSKVNSKFKAWDYIIHKNNVRSDDHWNEYVITDLEYENCIGEISIILNGCDASEII